MSTGPFWLALALGICVITLVTEVSGDHTALVWTPRNLPKKKPNILHIIMDDLGMDDAPWMTKPTKKTKKYFIVNTLQDKDTRGDQWLHFVNYYTHPHPLQTRVAMYTGKYAYKLGLSQHETDRADLGDFKRDQAQLWYSLPPNEKILPNYLKDIYYSTHLLGLWGLDSCYGSHFNYSKRGYDTFYGFPEQSSNQLWDNDKPPKDVGQEIITDLLTDRAVEIISEHKKSKTNNWRSLYIHMSHQARIESPMDPKCKKRCSKIIEFLSNHRCKMLCSVDKGLKKIMKAFEKAGYDENLLVVFSGHNAPSLDLQAPLYSGGTPTPAFVYSKTLLSGKENWKTKTIFNAASWLPTLLSAAGRCDKKIPKDIDGTNLWKETQAGEHIRIKEFFVVDIDTTKDSGAIRNNKEMLVRFNNTWEYYKLKKNKRVNELNNAFNPNKRKLQKKVERYLEFANASQIRTPYDCMAF